MKRVRLLFGVVGIIGLLASCALIPPISVGKDALGYSSEPMVVTFGTVATGFAPQAAVTGSANTTVNFADVELPALPIRPSSFESIQGFDDEVTVTGDLPPTIAVSGTLTLTLDDVAAGEPAAVVKEVTFDGLTLNKDADCTGSPCSYEFSNPADAATALRTAIAGADMGRMLEIISEGGDNQLTITLDVTVDSEPAFNGTIQFTIVVEDNFIRF